MEPALRKTAGELSDAGFSVYPKDSNASLKGIAVSEPSRVDDRNVKARGVRISRPDRGPAVVSRKRWNGVESLPNRRRTGGENTVSIRHAGAINEESRGCIAGIPTESHQTSCQRTNRNFYDSIGIGIHFRDSSADDSAGPTKRRILFNFDAEESIVTPALPLLSALLSKPRGANPHRDRRLHLRSASHGSAPASEARKHFRS